jgi:hypothetical protein
MFKKTKYDYSSWAIPTDEDVLDVNFSSIVSDLRAIVSGTLAPRSWADLSSTWNHETDMTRGNYSAYTSRKLDQPKKSTYVPKAYDMRRVNAMVRILVKSGRMTEADARVKAIELLVFTPTTTTEGVQK